MAKELTITVDEQVYDGLHSIVGRDNISGTINALVRAHVLEPDLDDAYARMAADKDREAEALEWAEATIGDVSDAAR